MLLTIFGDDQLMLLVVCCSSVWSFLERHAAYLYIAGVFFVLRPWRYPVEFLLPFLRVVVTFVGVYPRKFVYFSSRYPMQFLMLGLLCFSYSWLMILMFCWWFLLLCVYPFQIVNSAMMRVMNHRCNCILRILFINISFV
jgi:hypothetical protein